MKARGDAINVKVVIPESKYDNFLERKTLHSTEVGQFWRRPYTIYGGAEPRTFVRFNYKWYLLRHDNSTMLTDSDLKDFETDPGRFNGEFYER